MADDAQLLEEGDIFFFYRPKTNEDDPSGVDDVQQFYLALRPTGGKLVRLCVAGRKYMPKVGEHQRVWGFVDMVADEGRRIEEELREFLATKLRTAIKYADEGAVAADGGTTMGDPNPPVVQDNPRAVKSCGCGSSFSCG